MFFDSWTDLVRIALIGTLSYAALIVLLRITGKRTLSKMNVFDFVVTIAIGSTLATIFLSRDVALADGVAALALLIMLQWIVAWMSTRFGWFRDLVKARPRLLFEDGHMISSALRDERVTPEEVYAAIRAAGRASLEEVAAVVLETDGSFSVVGASTSGRSALQNVVST
jgi:uncharacterized membrane protein YcaP (DUF421 family)